MENTRTKKIEQIAKTKIEMTLFNKSEGHQIFDLEKSSIVCNEADSNGNSILSIKLKPFDKDSIYCSNFTIKNIIIDSNMSEQEIASRVADKIKIVNKSTKRHCHAIRIASKFFKFGEPDRKLGEDDLETIEDMFACAAQSTLDGDVYDTMGDFEIKAELKEDGEGNYISVRGSIDGVDPFGNEREYTIDTDFDVDLRSFEEGLVQEIRSMLYDRDEISELYMEKEEEENE